MDKKTTFNIWYIVAAVLGVILLQNLWTQGQHVEAVPYSEFQQYLRDGKIDSITITENYIQGALKGPSGSEPQHFVTARVEPSLAAEISKYGCEIASNRDPTLEAS